VDRDAHRRDRALGPLLSSRSGDPVAVIDDDGPVPVLVATTGAMGALAVTFDGIPLPFPLRLALGLVWLAACGFLPWLVADWRRRARVTRVAPLGQIRETADGTPVRVAGAVEAVGEAFLALASAQPAVFARTAFFARPSGASAAPEPHEDVRGVRFELRLDDGVVVGIDPVHVRLVDQARPVKVGADIVEGMSRALQLDVVDRGVVYQALLAPGDRVEAAGRLVRVVDPLAQAAPARGVPVGFTLAPSRDGHVWIRRLQVRRRLPPATDPGPAARG
jgi:hypothetical protein